MKNVAILMLAAGTSTRMRGSDKLMEKIDGRPLLRRQAKAACATGMPVFVTLHPGYPGRKIAVYGLPVTQVMVDSANMCKAASIRTGVLALPADTDGVLIVLSDMPDLIQSDFETLRNAFKGDNVVRAASQTMGGHPVLIPRRMFGDLTALKGDQGARDLITQQDITLVDLPCGHALTDLDTPEDWADWRRQHSH